MSVGAQSVRNRSVYISHELATRAWRSTRLPRIIHNCACPGSAAKWNPPFGETHSTTPLASSLFGHNLEVFGFDAPNSNFSRLLHVLYRHHLLTRPPFNSDLLLPATTLYVISYAPPMWFPLSADRRDGHILVPNTLAGETFADIVWS